MVTLPQIDTTELIRRVPGLSAVRIHLQTWDRFGARLMEDLLRSARSSARFDFGNGERSSVRPWMRAKMEMYRLLATHDPVHADMRDKLVESPPSSTGELISQLALWLSGVIGIPLPIAASLVSVALFRVAGNPVHELLPSETERIG